MKRIFITSILLVLGIITCICVSDPCNCWRWHEFGGCKPWTCTPTGDPNDPDTTWWEGWNVLPHWCEDVNDVDKNCSETTVSGYCASGKVYWDEDCTDYKTYFAVTYNGKWATVASDLCE